MQVVSIIGIIANIGLFFLFAKNKKWSMSVAFLFSAAYTLFSKLVHLESLPEIVVNSFVYIFAILVFYSVAREVFNKTIGKKSEA